MSPHRRNCFARGRAVCSRQLGKLARASSAMVAKATNDPRVWSATSVDEARNWYFPLPAGLLADLRGVVAAAAADTPITDIRLSESQRAKWSEPLAGVLRDLEEGRGFIIIDRLP